MSFFRSFLLLLTIASLGLYAGAPEDITKGSQLEKAFQLFVEHKNNANDENKLTITVSFKRADYSAVDLVSAGTSAKIIPVADGDMMKVTFDLRKEDLESSRLIIQKSAKTPCGNLYAIKIMEYAS